MTKKSCTKCGVLKPLEEFHKHPQMKDGHLNECKVCRRLYSRKLRAASVEEYRAYDRQRNATPERRAVFAEKLRRQRIEKAGQSRAHNAVKRAVARGVLVRPAKCQRCPATANIQAHHDTYAKPLSVMWLCPVCHAVRHLELGRLTLTDD